MEFSTLFIFFVFKIQAHVVAFMHIEFVYDEHCCNFLGMVGALLTSLWVVTKIPKSYGFTLLLGNFPSWMCIIGT